VSDDLRISITDSAGKRAYPIAAFTYILVYQNQTNASKGKALARFLHWAVHEGQAFVASLHYAPLPDDIVVKVRSKLSTLSSNGTPIIGEKS